MKNWVILNFDAILIGIAAFLLPIQPLIFTIGGLIVIDLLTGTCAAYKKKEKITSRRMADTIFKMIFYNIAVLSGFLLEYLAGNAIPIVNIVASIIGTIEFYSILENVSTMTNTDIVDRVKEVFKRKNIEDGQKID